MMGPIPFEVPAKFVGELAAGNLVRAGGLLKDAGSGQIVAHLQETGLAQNLINTAVSSPFSPLEALSAPSALVANVQLVQLKSMMKALQFINLGATVAGIGVSAMGFAVMNSKLNALQSQLVGFADRVEMSFRVQYERELRTHFSHIHGLFNEADQAHSLSDASSEWMRIAGVLAEERAYFRGELDHLVQSDTFDIDLFSSFTRSYALCDTGRIECLILSQELEGARKVSEDVAKDYNTLYDPLIPIKLAHNSTNLADSESAPFGHRLREELVATKNLIANVRDMQDAAMSKPYLIGTLIDRDINGREYLQTITKEDEQSILLLEAA